MGLKRKCESADEEREEADEEGGREANQIGDGSAYSPLLGIFSGLQHLFPPPTTPAPSQEGIGGRLSRCKRSKQVHCDANELAHITLPESGRSFRDQVHVTNFR